MKPSKLSLVYLCLDNLINGNISDAKKQARRFNHFQLRITLIENYGYSQEKADLAADLLKGRDCWQLLCNTK